MKKSNSKKAPRQKRVICVPCDLNEHNKMINDAVKYRAFIDKMIKKSPELFPSKVHYGYHLKEIRYSKKLKIYQRRILIEKTSYTIKPSCLMPYMSGLTSEVEKALYLRQFNVPYDALSYVFGRDAMYWYRMETGLGRYNLVASTIKKASLLPKHLIADEKHSRLQKEKVYIATTCANECVLGVSIAKKADEASLTQAYGVFQQEAQQLDTDYSPTTVVVDGWKPTKKSWLNLFPLISIIQCFLHIFLGLKQKATQKTRAIFLQLSDKLWHCYQAPHKNSFSQRVRRLFEWVSIQNELPQSMLEKLQKFKDNLSFFKIPYQYPQAYRTSNLLDRLMLRMDHRLFDTQYFHGSIEQAELGIRAWALIHNFAPSTPVTIAKRGGCQSPAEFLNQHTYHKNWLHNLLVSAHRAERKTVPPNPL